MQLANSNFQALLPIANCILPIRYSHIRTYNQAKYMGKQVTIIGGGVIGLCSAYYLQKEGYEVTVIEKGDITDGTSFGNAGYVSPSHFVPLATPGIVAQGLRWMLSSTSPFYIKPRLNLDLIKWLMTFWKQANAQTVKQNVPPLNEILHLSRELTSELKNELGNNF